MFFDIISIWVKFIKNTPTDLFVKYFCEFFDTPGVPGGVFWSTGEILPSWLDFDQVLKCWHCWRMAMDILHPDYRNHDHGCQARPDQTKIK